MEIQFARTEDLDAGLYTRLLAEMAKLQPADIQAAEPDGDSLRYEQPSAFFILHPPFSRKGVQSRRRAALCKKG